MGAFNLNQLLTEVSKNAAPGGGSRTSSRPAAEIVYLSVYDIVPSDENFYSMNDIEELKDKIELAGKVLQNLVVVPLDGGKYKAIAGHRRRLASIALVEEGKPQYEFVPCVVEENEADAEVQAIREEIMLIAANSQREKTAWDKIEETRRTRALLERAKKQDKIPGDMRKHIAKTLNTTPSQIGRYDAIIRNLCPAFMAELKEDRINISTAVELSGLSAEDQQAAFEKYRESGTISIKEARAKKPEPAAVREEPGTQEPPPSSPPAEASARTPRPPEPPRESEKRQQDPAAEPQETPAPLKEEHPKPEPPRPTPPPEVKKDETEEIGRTLLQLKSLRDYCECMNESDTDDGSRVWALDVDALDYAISILNRG